MADWSAQVEQQLRKIQFAVRHAVDQAIADCPDVSGVSIDIRARVIPQLPTITINVENKD